MCGVMLCDVCTRLVALGGAAVCGVSMASTSESAHTGVLIAALVRCVRAATKYAFPVWRALSAHAFQV